ncbi:hypothetical protein VZT92_016130 [Zoarces viviparus]|uniref:Uncharacterized protein n=2 Tax=Zoarces viviparus TaxID=48416 RepID=A0AAW1ESQ6_ZOAVI
MRAPLLQLFSSAHPLPQLSAYNAHSPLLPLVLSLPRGTDWRCSTAPTVRYVDVVEDEGYYNNNSSRAVSKAIISCNALNNEEEHEVEDVFPTNKETCPLTTTLVFAVVSEGTGNVIAHRNTNNNTAVWNSTRTRAQRNAQTFLSQSDSMAMMQNGACVWKRMLCLLRRGDKISLYTDTAACNEEQLHALP